MDELIYQVEEWATNKNLHHAESSKQFLKVTEEVGEVAAALARSDKKMLTDGIGDVVVTLIILALQNGLSLEECLQMAYDEIKGRKGKMIDGVFVKDADLKQPAVNQTSTVSEMSREEFDKFEAEYREIGGS